MANPEYVKISSDMGNHSSSQSEWEKGTRPIIFKGHPFVPDGRFEDALGVPEKWTVSVRVDADGNLLLKKERL
jgi:hypothetical protein